MTLPLPAYEPVVRQICGVDFVFTDYKEPLVQLEGAVPGYMRGTLPNALADGRLPCAFCDPSKTHEIHGAHVYRRADNLFDGLATHVRIAHGMSPRGYREAIGLLQRTPLISRRVRLTLRGQTIQNHGGQRGAWRAAAGLRASSHAPYASSPEYQNKRGVCADQIRAVARVIAKSNGGILRQSDLWRQHVWDTDLRRHGWANVGELAREVGAQVSPHYRKWSDAEMLRALRELAVRLGRAPMQRELSASNGTPSGATYFGRFGSLPGACRLAGVPNCSGRGDEADILAWYSTLGSVVRTARVVRRDSTTVSSVLAKYGVSTWAGGRPDAERQKARAWAAEMAQRLAGPQEEQHD